MLVEAARIPGPTIDVRSFLFDPPSNTDNIASQFPAILIYFLNMFAKSIISQFANEAGVEPKNADPIGVTAISMFATSEFRWQSISLIDILIAKFHVTCPVLFGIYGNDKMEAGRKRLGWWRENGSWVSEQRHAERMTGLASGFAALSLRDFKNAKSTNPYPPRHFWRALATILNMPPTEVTETHFIVLKPLLEHHVERIIGFFGIAGIAALRKAVVDFPKIRRSVASTALSTLATILTNQRHLVL